MFTITPETAAANLGRTVEEINAAFTDRGLFAPVAITQGEYEWLENHFAAMQSTDDSSEPTTTCSYVPATAKAKMVVGGGVRAVNVQ